MRCALGHGLVLSGLGIVAMAAHAAVPSSADAISVADQFVHAQAAFDVDTLRRLTAEDYVEVSPVGDVDPREKMLSFYGPESKTEGVSVKVTEPSVRTRGDTAVVIALVAFNFKDASGKAHPSTLRGTFVEQKSGDGWKLLSTQFTPYYPAKPKQETHG